MYSMEATINHHRPNCIVNASNNIKKKKNLFDSQLFDSTDAELTDTES